MINPIEELLAHARLTASGLCPSRVIGVDGPSGAGKTTFADSLAETLLALTGTPPQIVHMDDLYPGWNGLAEAVDLVVSRVLEPLSRGEGGMFERWDWLAGERAETVHVRVADWIVLEGVGSGSRRCRPHLAALAWLEADPATRLARGIERDGEAFRPHWEHWAQQEERLFAAEDTRTHAQAIVRT